jgi:hypothetical protein
MQSTISHTTVKKSLSQSVKCERDVKDTGYVGAAIGPHLEKALLGNVVNSFAWLDWLTSCCFSELDFFHWSPILYTCLCEEARMYSSELATMNVLARFNARFLLDDVVLFSFLLLVDNAVNFHSRRGPASTNVLAARMRSLMFTLSHQCGSDSAQKK